MTASKELYDKVKQLQHLLRHQVPGGDLAAIIERAVDGFLEKTLKQRFAQVSKPRTSASESREVGIRERADAAAARDGAAAQLDAPTATAVAPRKPEKGESARLTSASESRERMDAAAARDAAAAHVDASTTTAVAPRKPVDGESVRPLQNGRSRYIPRAVVREVFARDGARCTFVSASGQRCEERGMLELHHIRAFALGGRSTVENLTLVCRAHKLFRTLDPSTCERNALRRGLAAINLSCSDSP
jgi:hypothetical protein